MVVLNMFQSWPQGLERDPSELKFLKEIRRKISSITILDNRKATIDSNRAIISNYKFKGIAWTHLDKN